MGCVAHGRYAVADAGTDDMAVAEKNVAAVAAAVAAKDW